MPYSLDKWMPYSLDKWMPYSLDKWMPYSLNKWMPYPLDKWMPYSLNKWIPYSLDKWIAPYTKYFLLFTATTATFGVKSLIYNRLSGDSRGGSRVIKVTVEAVISQKTPYYWAFFKSITDIIPSNFVLKSR